MRIRCCLAALPLIMLGACGSDPAPDAEPTPMSDRGAQSADPSGSATTGEPTSSPAGTRVQISGSEFGQMLFDSNGQAIYLFDIEATSKPECYDACAEAWPPVLTRGMPVAGKGVERSLLGTTERSDGTTQVTYNDHPLYFYAHEGKNEVKCHDIFLNGGNWYVVRPDGDAAPPG